MGQNNEYTILGVGAPVVDLLVSSQDELLEYFEIEKGGSALIDYPTLQHYLRHIKQKPIFIPGGSGANTIKGLARLGEKCALVGKIGQDEAGKEFNRRLKEAGITSLLIPVETPTAQALCLRTPDGERTIRTYLGAALEMRGEDLDPKQFEGVKLVHIEGYSLSNERLTLQAMRLAKQQGALVSFDLASFDIIQAYRKPIIFLISNYVDILFANAQETKALTGLVPEKGCDFLKDLNGTVIVLMGKEGCWVGQGENKVRCPAFPVEPIDTTGAGDLFASGFLHGYLKGLPLEECARYGALTGGAVVQVIGAEIPPEEWERIKAKL